MKNIIKFSIIFLSIALTGNSQNIADAFRLSFNQINGTARASAMGNAFGSLGGDFTSLSINPAGIGIYRSNEFVVTPGMSFNESKLSFSNSSFMDNNYRPDLNNIGFVGIINTKKDNSGLISFNWGIGLNKVLDFNQVSFGKKVGSPLSFIDDLVYNANNKALTNDYLNENIKDIGIEDWPTKLAWDTYLFDPALDNQGNEIDKQYVGILYQNELVDQRKSFEQKGGINEFVISGGLNFNHKFYIGATLGMSDVNLNQITRYSENFGENSFVFSDDYSLTGNGYNLKLGIIFKPVNTFRLGFAFHSPTYYNLQQSNTYSIESNLLTNHYSDGINLYDYKFLTPFKSIFSGAIVLGKNAIISADAELLNYTKMRFRNSYDDLSDLNSSIAENFKGAFNLRIGGEYKITPQFSLRGGFENYANPYKSSLNLTQPVLSKNSTVLAGGIGYSTGNFFTDVTYKRITSSYTLNEIQPNFEDINLQNNNNKVLFTLGFRF